MNMATMPPACLYQGTKLNLDPIESNTVVDVFIPTQHTPTFSSRTSPKRRRVDRSDTIYTEETFCKRHLATATSIHFRPHVAASQKSSFPRCILWRVVEDKKVLELKAVDLHQEKSQKTDALLTLRFNFNSPIRPTTIAFTEKESKAGSNSLLAYILTEVGELHVITLNRDAFAKLEALDDVSNIQSWHQSSRPPAFAYKTPYKLFALNADEVWASLADGAIVRLVRNYNEQSSVWRETFFSEKNWSVLGLFPWKSSNTVRFGDADLHPHAATSISVSPDRKHIWAVCLDHTLRVWNIESGNLSYHCDLSGQEIQDAKKAPEHWLDPGSSGLIEILQSSDGSSYIVLTFSPKTREFKFWHIRDADNPDHGIQEMHTEFKFAPPVDDLAGVTVWSLDSFRCKPPRKKNDPWTLWIFVRSGASCFTFSISFKLEDSSKTIERCWRHDWISAQYVFDGADSISDTPPELSDTDFEFILAEPSGIVDKWIDYIFYPGRFSLATLETALNIYLKGFGVSDKSFTLSAASSTHALKEKICEAIGAFDSLPKSTNTTTAFAQYVHVIGMRWKTFHGVLIDLHQRRQEAFGLVYDLEEDMPWLVMADIIAPLRLCKEIEVLWQNRDVYFDYQDFKANSAFLNALSDVRHSDIGQLFYALGKFRANLPRAFLSMFSSTIQAEINRKEQVDIGDQIELIYDRSGFAGIVSEDDFTILSHNLSGLGGMQELTTELFLTTLELLRHSQQGKPSETFLSRFGTRTLTTGAQEILHFGSRILLDQILLVVFIAVELNPDELSQEFNPATVFSALLDAMKELSLLNWLAENTQLESPSLLESSDSRGFPQSNITDCRKTFFEAIFIGDWNSLLFSNVTLTGLLTQWIWTWTISGPALSNQYNKISLLVMGYLLKKGLVANALDFSRFLPDSTWSTYLMGRLHVINADYVEAARCFEVVANDLFLGNHFNAKEVDTANLLNLTEREWFTAQNPRIYQHIVDTFEHFGAVSFAADFAKMALDAMESIHDQDASLRTELLSRLFTALVRTTRFHEAYETLTKYTDFALRKSALHTLIDKLLASKQIPLFLSLEFPEDIANEADAHLSELSKPRESNGSFVFAEPSGEDNDFHKILYAFRLRQNNVRGAAMALWERLIKLKIAQRRGMRGGDIDEQVAETYLALINALSLMDADQAWILTTPLPKVKESTKRSTVLIGATDAKQKLKRQVVTLTDVRRLWQEELDRVADLEAGRYPFGLDIEGYSEEDDDESMGDGMEVEVTS